jgi:hypothetical protein
MTLGSKQEITERDARVSELENKLKKYRSDEIEKEVEKLEKQNANEGVFGV